MSWKKYIWAVSYGIVLTAFTVYTALDTFVISKVYNVVSDSENKNYQKETAEPAVITENSYNDENIKITINTHREYNTTIYTADITISSPEFLKAAFAKNSYGKNITAVTSETAAEHNAILAVNGDFYGVQEKGYVIRKGILYRNIASENQEDLVVYKDGSFEIIREDEVTAEKLYENGAVQVFSFGPALIEDGKISVSKKDEVKKALASNPRTAIGIYENGHYIFAVSDGRTSESEGLSLYEFAEFMQGLGAETVYNLDGGGSSTMYFNGKIVNKPTSNGKKIKERKVSDIVYIGY